MNRKRALGIAGVLLVASLVFGCGTPDGDSGSTSTGTSTTAPSNSTDPYMNPTTPTSDKLNTDAQLFELANPCKLVTAADLKKLFEGNFSNILGTDDSPVTDIRENTRACGYTSNNARIDHETNYSITAVSLTITTSLDNQDGVLWRAHLDAMSMSAGEHAAMSGADDLIRHGQGWYTARRGQVIIEVNDINSELTDDGAKRILAVALAKLS